MNILDLMASMSLDSSGFDEGLESAKSKAADFGKSLANGLKKGAEIGAAAIAAVGTAAVAVTGALIKGASEVAEYGDSIDKMSQKMGISTDAYQEWDAVLQHSGTDISTMQKGIKSLTAEVDKNNEAFTALGFTQEQLANMSNEELFSNTVTALQNVTDESERARLANELFGKSAAELGPLLNTTAEDTQAMKDRVHELGGVLSEEAVKASAAYQDALQDMNTAIDGTKRNLQAEFLPAFTGIMNGITETIIGGDGLPLIADGVNNFISTVNSMIPRVISIGKSIIGGLSKAILENLPSLLQSGLDILKAVIQGISDAFPLLGQAAMETIAMLGSFLVDNLPLLIQTALDLVMFLANAIVESLPNLIPAALQIILDIVDILTQPDTLMQLVDLAIILILALADGLIDALPKLLEKAPQIIENLVTALVAAAPKLIGAALELIVKLAGGIISNLDLILEAAAQIVFSLITGIVQMLGNLVMLGADIGNSIKDGFWDFIEGAKTWGKDLIDNFIGGIKQKWSDLKDAVSGVAQTVADFLGFSEPKYGPLSNFHTYAPDMMDLFMEGIESSKNDLSATLTETLNVIPATTIKQTVQQTPALAGAGAGDIIIPVYMGDTLLDTVVVNALDRVNFLSSGRA